MNKTHIERDLGIYINSNVKWADQINKATNKAFSVIGTLKRTFQHWDCFSFVKLFTAYVRPHLEYCVQLWNPRLKKDIELLERVQRRATKLVPQIRFLAYEKRLEILGLSTLSGRRERGDLIQYFKIHNHLKVTKWIQPNQQMSSIKEVGPAGNIRGSSHRLNRQFTNCMQRETFFTNRVVPNWNRLPNEVSVNCMCLHYQ